MSDGANLTPGQPFTPPAVAAHLPEVEEFAVGDEANEPTKEIAENGNLGLLVELIQSTDAIRVQRSPNSRSSRSPIRPTPACRMWPNSTSRPDPTPAISRSSPC